jgi:hypothetical protein
MPVRMILQGIISDQMIGAITISLITTITTTTSKIMVLAGIMVMEKITIISITAIISQTISSGIITITTIKETIKETIRETYLVTTITTIIITTIIITTISNNKTGEELTELAIIIITKTTGHKTNNFH